MADGNLLLSSSPSSPLEDGELVPQALPDSKLNFQPKKPSYASILQARDISSSAASIAQGQNQGQHSSVPLSMVEFRDPATTILKPISQHQGKPAVHFLVSEKKALVDKLNLVLIGKFTHGRPSLSMIKVFFLNLKLQGVINVSLADSKHIFIECSILSDYYWLWLNLSLTIHGFEMRIFKWGADFSPRIESPIAPVWIRIVGMPLYLFDEMSVWQISGAVGKPIKIDNRNLSRSILNVARVCVELDISQQPTDTIWVCIKEENTDIIVERICLQVLYDVLPLYCTVCSHIGHGEDTCKRKRDKGLIVDAKTEFIVEPSSRMNHSTGPVIAASCSAPPKAVTTVWMPVKKGSAAVNLNSKNRFGSLTLQGDEDSKALDVTIEGVHLSKTTTANEAKSAHPMQNRPAIVNRFGCINLQAKTSTDEAAPHLYRTLDTIVACVVETDQSIQSKTSADLIKNNSENRYSEQIEITDLAATSEHDWHLVTGKKNKNTIKTQSATSIPLTNPDMLKVKLSSSGKESVELPTQQMSPGTSNLITTTLHLQQETEQTKKHQQQIKVDTDSQELHRSEGAIENADAITEKVEQVVSVDADLADTLGNHPYVAVIVEEEQIHTSSQEATEKVSHEAENSQGAMKSQHSKLVQTETMQLGEVETQKQPNKEDKDHIGQQFGTLLDHKNSVEPLMVTKFDSLPNIEGQNAAHSEVNSKAITFVPEPAMEEFQIDEINKAAGVARTKQGLVIIEEMQECYTPALKQTIVDATPDSSAQEWQIVGKKNNKAIGDVTKIRGVVTRSQMKASHDTRANKVEEEHKIQPTIKALASHTTKQSKKQLERKISKLGSRLNNMGDRHKMRSQLEAEMDALQEEYSLLC